MIHLGCGGIGLAAIRVAFAYGLEVFTTVNSQDKKEFLLSEFPQLKKENIGSSENTSFEDMILIRTKGMGVDYILNSLSDEKLHASLRCLHKDGKFLQIGKLIFSNDSKVSLENLLNQLSFHVISIERFVQIPENRMVIK